MLRNRRLYHPQPDPTAAPGAGGAAGEGDKPIPPDPQEGEGEKFDPARAMETIKRQREAEAAAKAEAKAAKAASKEAALALETAKAQLKAYEDAKLSDSERDRKKIGELEAAITAEQQKASAAEARLRDAVIDYEIRLAASGVSVPPEIASKLIEREKITFDDSGKPNNVADLLGALVKKYPQIVERPAGTPPGTPRLPDRKPPTQPAGAAPQQRRPILREF